jgi:hypothetical protein
VCWEEKEQKREEGDRWAEGLRDEGQQIVQRGLTTHSPCMLHRIFGYRGCCRRCRAFSIAWTCSSLSPWFPALTCISDSRIAKRLTSLGLGLRVTKTVIDEAGGGFVRVRANGDTERPSPSSHSPSQEGTITLWSWGVLHLLPVPTIISGPKPHIGNHKLHVPLGKKPLLEVFGCMRIRHHGPRPLPRGSRRNGGKPSVRRYTTGLMGESEG